MASNDVVPSNESCQRPVARRRHRGAAKLTGAVGLAVVACILAGHSLWSFRDEWAALTDDGHQIQRLSATTIDDLPLVRGGQLYAAHCLRCHGAEGHGDGPALTDARERPRDFASASWRSGADRTAVRRVIQAGTAHKAVPPLPVVLTTGELDAIVDYVCSLEILGLVAKARLSAGSGALAPPAVFRDADGLTGTLEQLRGKVVVLSFWGTTCVPCRKELPDLALLAKKFENNGVVVLPICLDETDAKIASEVAASIAPDLHVYVDYDGSVRKAYKIRHLPQTLIVDREGRMLAHASGGENWSGEPMEALFRSFGVSQ